MTSASRHNYLYICEWLCLCFSHRFKIHAIISIRGIVQEYTSLKDFFFFFLSRL